MLSNYFCVFQKNPQFVKRQFDFGWKNCQILLSKQLEFQLEMIRVRQSRSYLK